MKKSKSRLNKRITSIPKSLKIDYSKPNFKKIHCSKCGSDMIVASDAASGICWRCVCKMVPVDVSLIRQPSQNKPSGNPRGWKKMKLFVDASGDVYIKGILQPMLKNTLPITVVKKKEKNTLSRKKKTSIKHTEGAIISDLTKKLALAKTDKKKSKIQLEINSHQEILNQL